MNLNFKHPLFLGIFTFVITLSVRAQEKDLGAKDPETIHVEAAIGINLPTTTGNNFVNRALTVKAGFTGELAIFFNAHYYLGYQGVFNASEVEDTALVGLYDSSTLRHHYLIGGYSFSPKTSTIGWIAGVGVGHANYRNKKENTVFFDKGFALMANTRVSYRFSKYLGFFAGVQLSKDFLNIETAPEQKDFFKEARFFNVSTGLVLSIGA